MYVRGPWVKIRLSVKDLEVRTQEGLKAGNRKGERGIFSTRDRATGSLRTLDRAVDPACWGNPTTLESDPEKPERSPRFFTSLQKTSTTFF